MPPMRTLPLSTSQKRAIRFTQQQGETEYQAAQQQEDSQYQQQYQEPQYQESGYTEEQEQQFNEFGSRVWEDAKESISESFSEGLDGFLSPETIAQGLELGKIFCWNK